MKNYIIIFIFALISANYSQSLKNIIINSDNNIDSIITTDNQGVKAKFIYSYNGNHKILFVLRKYWTGSNWMDNRSYEYTYDNSENLIKKLVKAYDQFSDVWIDWERYTYSYNNDGQLLRELKEQISSGEWYDFSRYTFEYDQQGNIISEVYELANPSPMLNYRKYLFSYDANNNISQKITQWWINDAWVNFSLTTYDYNEDKILGYKTDRMNEDSWVDYQRAFCHYDGYGNKDSVLVQAWDAFNQLWVNDTLYTSSYNSDNLITENLMKRWDGEVWRNSTKSLLVYNSELDLVTWEYKYLYNENWERGTKPIKLIDKFGNIYSFYTGEIDIYYGTPVEVEVMHKNTIDFALYQNYPNPFNPSTKISFTLPEESNVKLVIYNLLGEEVATLINREMNAGFHSVNFDASSVNRQLSSCLYFYRISAGNASSGSAQSFVDVKKMLLLK